MSTTSLKLPDPLKARIAPLAEAAGVTPHAWMVSALSSEIERAEQRAAFVQDALNAADEVDAGGKVYRAEDVHTYLRSKASGKAAKRPRTVKR